jgi:hypothetical protein
MNEQALIDLFVRPIVGVRVDSLTSWPPGIESGTLGFMVEGLKKWPRVMKEGD